MDKSKIGISITICIICIILTFGLTVQLRTVKETDITSIENMREDELKEQIEIWKTKYKETQQEIEQDNEKIKEYKNNIENNQEVSELLNNEYMQINTILGKTDVEGEGIIITLEDKDEKITSEDLLKLLNELKNAGAEVISINNQRVINLTDIVDVNSYILVNGKRQVSPYEIKVIGNSQYLTSAIRAKGGFSDNIKSKGKDIKISEEKNVIINKYDEEIKIKSIKID